MFNKDLKVFTRLLFSKGIQALIKVVYLSTLARMLGPTGLGEWAMIVGAATLLHSLLLNWMHPPTVRFGREEWRMTGSIATTWASRWPFIFGGLLLVFAALMFEPFHWLTQIFHLSNQLTLLVFISLLGLWFSIEAQNLFQVRGAMASLAYLPLSIDIASILTLLALKLWMVSFQEAYTIIILVQGGNALLWGGALLYIASKSRFRWEKPTREGLQRNLVYAWPLIPGCLLGFVSDWGDQLILRYFFTSREVGLFQSAYQVMMLLLGVPALMSTVLLPRLIDKNLAAAIDTKDFMTTAGPTTVALGLYLLFPLITFVPYLFQLFMGARFVEATGVFVVLCAAIPGSLLSSFYGIFFNLQGRFLRSTVILGAIKIALNLIISLLLVPRIGMMGSAIASIISYGVLQYLYARDQHRYYNVPFNKVLAMFGVVVLFSSTQAVAGADLLPRSVICCIGLILLTIVIRKFAILDRERVMSLCNRQLSCVGRFVLRIASPSGSL